MNNCAQNINSLNERIGALQKEKMTTEEQLGKRKTVLSQVQ